MVLNKHPGIKSTFYTRSNLYNVVTFTTSEDSCPIIRARVGDQFCACTIGRECFNWNHKVRERRSPVQVPRC